MKIVVLSVWYSEKMGYIENCLPKAWAALGHEVHVITSTAQVYYTEPFYTEVYEKFFGPPVLDPVSKMLDGFILHRLSFGLFYKKIYLKGLVKILRKISPDAVLVFDPFSLLTLQVVWSKIFLSAKLFTANHTVVSVFPLAQKDANVTVFERISFYFSRTIPGHLISLVTSRCYPATIDAALIAEKYYGVSRSKLMLAPLGVDTQFFNPTASMPDEREALREKLNIPKDALLCIYTGRFTVGKNPVILAQAINNLNKSGEKFRAVFLGSGPQKEQICSYEGCVISEFVPYFQLAAYYRASDIGVWPRQESTSMLDAAACGIPIIISDRVQATERIEGNGLTYIENDVNSMVDVLLKLKDKRLRKMLGDAGSNKMSRSFSWLKLAKDRADDIAKYI